ncbi:hypothetical protein SH528x_002799 [Novipirellula sp. SH528]|uniref:hypothetical protein n=1 Tax=Novipirellula sp. SH528 TaxID=3454466 RepID=UPI003FA0A824
MKLIPLLAGLCLLLSSASANAQTLLNIPFDNNDDLKHIVSPDPGLSIGTAFEQQSCLIVASDVDAQALSPVEVHSLQKYKLTVRAAVDDTDTVETNDRLTEILAKNRGKSFAACELTFFDDGGKETTFLLYGKTRMETDSVPIVSRQLHDFVTVFYAPPNAKTLQLKLLPRKRKLWIDSIVLEQEKSEPTENCNPDFRYGTFNLSGWDPDSEGRLYARADGETVLKCGNQGRSSFFAVDDQSRYSFLCKGTGFSSNAGKVTVSFYDITGNELGYTHLFWDRDMQNGATKAGIQPLPGSKLAMLKASRIILEKVMVTKDDPETN